MSRKKKEVQEGASAARSSRPSKMKSEMGELDLENAMMKKAISEREKNLDKLRKMKAEEELLLAGRPAPTDDDGEDDGAYFTDGRRAPFANPQRRPEHRLANSEEFENTLSEFQGGEGKVEVYRLKDNTYAKIGAFSAKEWGDSLEGVAKRFGGGTFKVKLRSPDGTFAGETVVTFDEEAYPKPSQRPVEQGVNQLELLKMLQDREEKNQDKFMMMMSTMMSTLAQTIGNKSNMISNMSDLASFKELFAKEEKSDKPDEAVMKLLNMYQMGMEFSKANAPVEGEGGFLGGLVKELLTGNNMTRLTDALKSTGTGAAPARPPAPPQIQRPAANPNPPAQSPVPVPPPAVPVPAPAEHPQQEAVQMDLKTTLIITTYRPIILGYAKGNADPRKVAEMIIARIPEEYLLIVDDFLKVETTKELWVYANGPELREYDAWVNEVMRQMSAVIAEAYEEEPAITEAELTAGPALPAGGEEPQKEEPKS